jgi:ATP-dependent RNA helicase SUPV3L1/SUV3
MFWEQAPVARVRRGASLLRPVAEILDSEFLEGHQRERVRIRLQAVLEGWVRSGLAPLFAAQETASRDSALRGVLHRLMESGGIAAPVDVPAPLRGKLKAAGIWGGRHALFLPALLKPRPARLRARLCALWNHSKLPSAAPPGAVSMTPPADWPTDLNHTLAQGFVAAGPVLVRLDIAERITAELAFATRRGQAVLPAGVASRLSIQAAHLPAVLRGLGFQVVPSVQLGPGELGPTLPAAILPMRPRRARPAPAPVVAVNKDSPFAALARLRTRA